MRGHAAFPTLSEKQHVPGKERGFVLLYVVVAITLVAAIALALGNQGATQTNIASGELQRDQLRYITEAGLAHARSQLSQSTTCDGYTNIPSTPFGAGTYAVNFTPAGSSPVTITATGSLATGAQLALSRDDIRVYDAGGIQRITLQPGSSSEDTYIEVDKPNDNYGSDNILMTDGEISGSGPIRSLLRFGLSGIPSSLDVIAAELSLYVDDDANTPPVVEAHRLLKSWVEGTGGNDGATWNKADGSTAWNNPGTDYDPAVEGSFVASGLGWKSMYVTSLVQGWADGSFPNDGMVLLSPPASGNNEITYHSSDVSDPTLRPKLTVTVACECGQICATDDSFLFLSTDSAAELGGLSFLDKDLVEYDRPSDVATLFFDSVAAGIGKKIDALHVLENGNLILSVDGGTTFAGLSVSSEDLFEYDPVAGTAKMFLHADTHFQSKKNIISVHMLDSGNIVLSTDGGATLGGLTFSDKDLVEYNRVTGQASIFFDGDATSLGKKISAVHIRNNGHIILTADGDATLGGLDFGPDQLIDYDPATDTAAMIFDGSTLFTETSEKVTAVHVGPPSGAVSSSGGAFRVLFVVGNASGLTGVENDHKTIIEGWGYTVEIIDDGATQTEFDAALVNSDVVFMTNDITSSNVGTKLVDATIGVVTSEVNLSDEFGLSSSIGWNSGTSINIDDNTHYITSPFSLGPLTVLEASHSLASVTGVLAPDLGQLASSASGYGVVTLDTGATLFGGDTAAGRRVQLPWGGSGFKPTDLNVGGLTILRRALEWAAGDGSGSGTNDIQVATGNDDAEERTSDGFMYLDSSDLELAFSSDEATDLVGIRFTNVVVPPGETISNAYIQFQVDETSSGVTSLTIEGEAVDDAAQFTSAAYDISSRPRTSASVSWTPSAWTTVGARGADQRTTDISPVLQEIVDRPGWSSGNAIVIIIDGSGTRTAEAFEGEPAGAAELHYEYGAGGGGGGSYYLDEFPDFTCGGGAEYRGSNGPLDWSGVAWTESGDDGEACAGDIRAMDDPDIVDVTGNRLRLKNTNRSIEREVDLGSFTTAYLSFDYRRDGMSGAANIQVEVSGNGGSTWSTVFTITAGTDTTYRSINQDISSYIASNTMIRFSMDDNFNNQAYVDNVRIDSSAGGGGGGSNTIRDEFNAKSFSGSDGTLPWATDWLEIGEFDGATSGDVDVRSDGSFDYVLRIRDNENGGEGVQREVDLSACSSATLTFNYRRNSFDDSNDYVTIDVSDNGGSTWTEVDRLAGPANESTYQPTNIDISAAIATNTRVRFLGSPLLGDTDELYIDDVVIACL
jgi:type II secretory pathway pseudopilin PulG